MENNKEYLDKFLFVFLVALGATAIQTFAPDIFGQRSGTLYSFFFELFFQSVSFISLGIALSQWRQAIIAIATTIVLQVLDYFVFDTKTALQNMIGSSNGGSNALWLQLIDQLFYLLPFIVFFIDGKTSFAKIMQVVAAVVIFRGITPAYFSQQFFGRMADDYSAGFMRIQKYAGLVFYTCMHIVRVVFYCELYNFVQTKKMGWQTKLLNPGNNYDKVGSMLVFYAIKVALLCIFIGQYFQMDALGRLSLDNANPVFKFYYYNGLANAFLVVPVLLFFAWYLRKLVLEYFISYNISSKFVYWLLWLPGIGFIVWLVLMQNKKAYTFNEKERAIQNFAGSSAQAVTVIVIGAMLLRLLLALVADTGAFFILSTVISVLLFVWLIKHRAGYYFNVYLTLGIIFLFCILFITVKSQQYQHALAVFYPFLLLNLAQLVAICPIYHFDSFSYIDEGEKENSDEKDLLAEFDS